jgi:hypothetical protein
LPKPEKITSPSSYTPSGTSKSFLVFFETVQPEKITPLRYINLTLQTPKPSHSTMSSYTVIASSLAYHGAMPSESMKAEVAEAFKKATEVSTATSNSGNSII